MIVPCPQCHQRNRIVAANLTKHVRCGSCHHDLGPISHPLDVDPESFDEIVSGAGVPVLVDFWAAWCGPCRMAAPEVKKTAETMAGRALVLKVDTERFPQLADRYHVPGIPHFAVLEDGA